MGSEMCIRDRPEGELSRVGISGAAMAAFVQARAIVITIVKRIDIFIARVASVNSRIRKRWIISFFFNTL